MRKLNLLIKSLLLLYALIVGSSSAWADTYSYNFSSGGTNNATANPATNTWVTDFFTILQEKNTSSTAVANYLTAPRWYQSHTITITPAASVTITKIVINCTSDKNGQTISPSTGSVSKSGNNSTWTGSITSSLPLVLTMGTQCRPSSIDITYTSTAAKCATPTFSPAAGLYTSAQSVTIGCETEGATIYYTTDGTDPTTSSSVYSAAIHVSTTTTIKAMAVKAGTSNSVVASAFYAILGHAGTEVDPYTVADARAAIDANAGLTDVYATGIVSEIVTEFSVQHQNISFNISTDGETTSDQLQAYRCAGLAEVTDASQVQVGDVVVIKGNLTKYNTTYEFAQGCVLTSLQHSQKETPTSVWKSGGNAVTSIVLTKGGSISATFETNSTGTKSFESSNTEVATVSNTGVISLTGKAGIATITASTASNNTYIASEAKLLIVIGEPVEDAVLNFGNFQDYGSGIVPGDAYYAEASTWTAGNISLTVSGKYRWFIANTGATDLRLYSQKESETETTKFTISAPSGKKLTKIVISGSSHGKLVAEGYSAGTWTGMADNVTFTYGAESGSINITSITVYYSGPTISVTMGNADYMTYCNVGAALSFEADGLKAFRVSSVGDDHVNMIEVTQAPANTPVVLKATASSSYNLTVIESAESVGTNKLKVSDGTKTSDESNEVYALAQKSDVVGFYKVKAGVTVPAGKCYLSVAKQVAEPGSARDFLGFVEEDATSINSLTPALSEGEGAVYDLQGRQVKQPTKGLYIKNGKKVIIK